MPADWEARTGNPGIQTLTRHAPVPMIEYLESAFESFRKCFSRTEAYHWFVVLVLGFMIRDDSLGVTSVIRALSLDGSCYETMLHFFYSRAWKLEEIRLCWYRLVARTGMVLTVDGRYVLAGDGVKQSKEAVYMPGVKKLYQESEDSSKGEYIFGHMFGAVGAIIHTASDVFCVPLMMGIQDGIRRAADWEGSTVSAESHVLQMVRCGFQAASTMGPSIILLDRYFLSVSAIRLLDELNKACQRRTLDIVTKAKRNAVAYEKAPARPPGKPGRPRKKGDGVHLYELFENGDDFLEGNVHLYGGTEKVKYLCRDYLWGKGLYRELRFVLVIMDGARSILASTDLTLPPEKIIELYGRRFRIENLFREFKQQIGGFCYHFWTKAIGKLDHFSKSGDPDPLDIVMTRHDREKVLQKIRAIEGFVQLACIAMGLLQIISFREKDCLELQSIRYLRTRRRETASEATVMFYLRRRFFALLATRPDSPIMQILHMAQHWHERRNRSA